VLPLVVIYPVDWIQYDKQTKAQLLILGKAGARDPLTSFGATFLPDGLGVFEIEISKMLFAFS
jgi:hypothetical protein